MSPSLKRNIFKILSHQELQNLVQNSVQLFYEEGFRHFVPTSLDARRGALAS